ncbi:MAG: 3-isopropylmalate dehydratase [Acidobacteria bacterium]|nr:3-isopropylmalate dehydratase [Acidobacteriota bacterium]
MKGKVHLYGDHVDTDQIIPGAYTKTLDVDELASHVFEYLDTDFRTRMTSGDFVVAGEDFGCGSSREQAPLALKAAGVAAVVASSFARIFYRNAINIGLPVVEIGPHDIENGSELEIDLEAGALTDRTAQRTYPVTKIPAVMLDILREGGLVPYLKKHGDYQL